MEIKSILNVRSYECDSYGHENNAVYPCIDKNGKPVRLPVELEIEELES